MNENGYSYLKTTQIVPNTLQNYGKLKGKLRKFPRGSNHPCKRLNCVSFEGALPLHPTVALADPEPSLFSSLFSPAIPCCVLCRKDRSNIIHHWCVEKTCLT